MSWWILRRGEPKEDLCAGSLGVEGRRKRWSMGLIVAEQRREGREGECWSEGTVRFVVDSFWRLLIGKFSLHEMATSSKQLALVRRSQELSEAHS
jgi:hypothetical protein